MLLHKSNEPFDDPDYISELKLDGIRLIVSKMDDQMKLYTRHHNDVTALFPELHSIDIPYGTILDGEIIVTDQKGCPDFDAMMERFQSRRSEHHVTFCAFDILYYDHDSVMYLPLIERKELLKRILPQHPHAAYVQHIVGRGLDYFALVKEKD